ncbi:MAG: hypothetical protein DWQ10_03820 [Calditrichaeota bacterium]|nr:MAG: hypothetical protein DWQ10_03820 [Calditrichota bacterium]
MVIEKLKYSLLFFMLTGVLTAQTGKVALQENSRLLNWQMQKIQLDESSSPGGGMVFMKSLLVPGWGQASLGAKTAMRNFLISEAVLLGASFGFATYRDWLQDDYKAYASSHAQVNPAGKDDVYWADIGDYLSIYEYNEAWLRRRSLDNLRNPAGGEFWEWDKLQNAQKYREMRVDADKAKTWSQFAIAGVITNHVVSALHALWLKRKQSRSDMASKQHYIIAVRPLSTSRGGVLAVRFQF